MLIKLISCLLIVFCLCSPSAVEAKTISKKEKRYAITVPDAIVNIIDTGASGDGDMYYDKAAGIILMISDRPSKFKSVTQYMDCSNEQLESQLKTFYSDTTLQLISCNRSKYYAKETVVLHFSVGVLSDGFTMCLVYFIHHKGNDLQFSFTYNKENAKASMQYIDDIMKTLELK